MDVRYVFGFQGRNLGWFLSVSLRWMLDMCLASRFRVEI